MDGNGEKVSRLAAAASALELDKVLDAVAEHALTPMAQAEIRQTPIARDPERIKAALALVTDYRGILDRGEDAPIEVFENIDPLCSALEIQGAVLPVESLIALARLAGIARRVRHFLSARREASQRLWHAMQHLQGHPEFEKAVEAAIDPATGEIRDSASPALRKIRRDIERTQQEVRKKLQHIARKAAAQDMLQEELITVREGRLVLMVKDDFRRAIGGIVHDQSASGQTFFIEPVESVELNNRIRQLTIREHEEIQRILAGLSAKAAEKVRELAHSYALLVRLDAIRARALYSRKFQCNEPIINADGRLVFYAARHPLLLQKLSEQEVVPLQLELGKTYTMLVISGPNAGGKTVAMKTVGLLVLMARMGLHIPASADSEIGLMGELFVDIGDLQSIENDLSTFTSHMSRLRDMLLHAGANDLVLIDEMGAGTDPEEGTALALAALESLQKVQVRAMVTTHHGALKQFAHDTPGVENGSMIFDLETLQPTYRFRPGLPGSSYAFDIVARIGMPEAIVRRARELLGSDKNTLDRLITEFEEKLQEQQELVRKNRLENDRLQALIRLYEERAAGIRDKERSLKKKALQESEEILQKANAAVEEAVRLIRSEQASRESIKKARALVEDARRAVREEKKKTARPEKQMKNSRQLAPGDVHVGDEVIWVPGNQNAVVLAEPDREKKVFIQAGSMKMSVPLQDLRKATVRAQKRSTSVRITAGGKVEQQLDIRGKRVDEALAATDQYLSDALFYGWDEVRIIHGTGTGALRKAVQELLQKHPRVARLKDAPQHLGGQGVTIVQFD